MKIIFVGLYWKATEKDTITLKGVSARDMIECQEDMKVMQLQKIEIEHEEI